MLNGEKFDPNEFIDSFLTKLGKESSLLFPTFNWDFCKGIPFDYSKTVSKTGALTKVALKRKDFTRTQHPIYSFAVWGKDKERLFNLTNKSSFGNDSPFAYLKNERAKMLLIDVSYQNSFTFVHYVEEMKEVNYRYMKEFTAPYIDRDGTESIRTYSMYVRNLERSITTRINPVGEIMEKRGVSQKKVINNIDFYLIDLAKAYEVIEDDIVNNSAKNLYFAEK